MTIKIQIFTSMLFQTFTVLWSRGRETLTFKKFKNNTEAEFKEFKPRLEAANTRFKLSAGLNLETFDTILRGTNHI